MVFKKIVKKKPNTETTSEAPEIELKNSEDNTQQLIQELYNPALRSYYLISVIDKIDQTLKGIGQALVEIGKTLEGMDVEEVRE